MRKETLDFINVNVRFITDRRQSEKVFYNEKTQKCSCKQPQPMRGERGCNLVYHSYGTQESQNIMCGGPRSLHIHAMHNSNNNDDSNTHVTLTIIIEIIICTTDDDERYPGAISVEHFPFYFSFSVLFCSLFRALNEKNVCIHAHLQKSNLTDIYYEQI